MATKKKIATRPRISQVAQTSTEQPIIDSDRCTCSPPSLLSQKAALEDEQLVLATPELSRRISSYLNEHLPQINSLSIVLFHIFQVAPASLVHQSDLPPKRLRHHAPPGFMEQILVNMHRVIRADDQVLLHGETGGALIFPGVDQQGANRIVERIYRSIDLLQAETVIPPLTRETHILLGSGSYPEQGATVEQLLCSTATLLHRLILRPALSPQLWDLPPLRQQTGKQQASMSNTPSLQIGKEHSPIPFLQLPQQLPSRLKHLISYQLAQEIRCAPVGRDSHSLTVAMAHPTDTVAQQRLASATGLTIFPVACEEEALNLLLENKW